MSTFVEFMGRRWAMSLYTQKYMKKNETEKGMERVRKRLLWEGNNIPGKGFRLTTWIPVIRASPHPYHSILPTERIASSKALRRVHAGVMEEQQRDQWGWNWVKERQQKEVRSNRCWWAAMSSGGPLHRLRIRLWVDVWKSSMIWQTFTERR